jgi:predicted O-methyltransferase YrrM
MEQVQARFERNIAPYGARTSMLKLKSPIALTMLRDAARTFDLVYVDGSHRRDDVLVDSLLCWPLLKPDGIAIWDDYGKQEGVPPAERAKEAIELFLSWHADTLVELHRGWQVIVRKTERR